MNIKGKITLIIWAVVIMAITVWAQWYIQKSDMIPVIKVFFELVVFFSTILFFVGGSMFLLKKFFKP